MHAMHISDAMHVTHISDAKKDKYNSDAKKDKRKWITEFTKTSALYKWMQDHRVGIEPHNPNDPFVDPDGIQKQLARRIMAHWNPGMQTVHGYNQLSPIMYNHMMKQLSPFVYLDATNRNRPERFRWERARVGQPHHWDNISSTLTIMNPTLAREMGHKYEAALYVTLIQEQFTDEAMAQWTDYVRNLPDYRQPAFFARSSEDLWEVKSVQTIPLWAQAVMSDSSIDNRSFLIDHLPEPAGTFPNRGHQKNMPMFRTMANNRAIVTKTQSGPLLSKRDSSAAQACTVTIRSLHENKFFHSTANIDCMYAGDNKQPSRNHQITMQIAHMAKIEINFSILVLALGIPLSLVRWFAMANYCSPGWFADYHEKIDCMIDQCPCPQNSRDGILHAHQLHEAAKKKTGESSGYFYGGGTGASSATAALFNAAKAEAKRRMALSIPPSSNTVTNDGETNTTSAVGPSRSLLKLTGLKDINMASAYLSERGTSIEVDKKTSTPVANVPPVPPIITIPPHMVASSVSAGEMRHIGKTPYSTPSLTSTPFSRMIRYEGENNSSPHTMKSDIKEGHRVDNSYTNAGQKKASRRVEPNMNNNSTGGGHKRDNTYIPYGYVNMHIPSVYSKRSRAKITNNDETWLKYYHPPSNDDVHSKTILHIIDCVNNNRTDRELGKLVTRLPSPSLSIIPVTRHEMDNRTAKETSDVNSISGYDKKLDRKNITKRHKSKYHIRQESYTRTNADLRYPDWLNFGFETPPRSMETLSNTSAVKLSNEDYVNASPEEKAHIDAFLREMEDRQVRFTQNSIRTGILPHCGDAHFTVLKFHEMISMMCYCYAIGTNRISPESRDRLSNCTFSTPRDTIAGQARQLANTSQNSARVATGKLVRNRNEAFVAALKSATELKATGTTTTSALTSSKSIVTNANGSSKIQTSQKSVATSEGGASNVSASASNGSASNVSAISGNTGVLVPAKKLKSSAAASTQAAKLAVYPFELFCRLWSSRRSQQVIDVCWRTQNWGSSRFRRPREGVIETITHANAFGFDAAQSTLTLTSGQRSKMTEARRVTPEQRHIKDPVHTPEGEKCGKKDHAAYSRVTLGTSTRSVIREIYRFARYLRLIPVDAFFDILYGLITLDQESVHKRGLKKPTRSFSIEGQSSCRTSVPLFFSKLYNVRVGGILIGWIPNDKLSRIHKVVDLLKTSSIGYLDEIDIREQTMKRTVEILTDAGRLACLAVVYRHWDNLKKVALEYTTKEMLIQQGILVSLTANEIANHKHILLATDDEDIKIYLSQGRTPTHVVWHPMNLFDSVSNQMPYLNHNTMPRSCYHDSMVKTAAPAEYLDILNCYSHTHRLLNAEKPMVSTTAVMSRPEREQCHGLHVDCTIGPYNGTNVDDPYTLRQGIVDRYGLAKVTRIVIKFFQKKSTMASNREQVERPNQDCLSMKHTRHDKLQSNGLPPVGTQIVYGDAVMGVTSHVQSRRQTIQRGGRPGRRRDVSIIHRSEPMWVVQSELRINADGLQSAKVVLETVNKVNIGDKFVSRHGQKGVISIIVADSDMMYDERTGRYPDIVVNPGAFPTRNTVGQPLEMRHQMAKAYDPDRIPREANAFEKRQKLSRDIHDVLVSQGLNPNGTRRMRQPHTGKIIACPMFSGEIYLEILPHIAGDKANARAEGPRQSKTRQPVESGTRGGGLRLGPMERNSLEAHGVAKFAFSKLVLSSDPAWCCSCRWCGKRAKYNLHEEWVFCFNCERADGVYAIFGATANQLIDTESMGLGTSTDYVIEPTGDVMTLKNRERFNLHLA